MQRFLARGFSNTARGPKIAIIGAGNVGSTTAYSLLCKNVAPQLLLADVNKELARAQALDLNDACVENDIHICDSTYKEAGESDIIVITAGAKQKQGESRLELIDKNYDMLKGIINDMQPIRKDAVMLIVSNPVDILTHIAQKLSGLPKSQVFGTGTWLDSLRLHALLASILKVSPSCIHAHVLGEHGDSQFIAWNSASVTGRPLMSFPEARELNKDAVHKQISGRAMEIISGKGSTYYGIGACAASLCDDILRNTLDIRPVSVHVDKLGTVLSMPAKIGARGVHQVYDDILLSKDEQEKLLQSAETLKDIAKKYS